MIDGDLTHTSDLAALEDLARRFGFSIGSGAVDQIYREPSSLQT